MKTRSTKLTRFALVLGLAVWAAGQRGGAVTLLMLASLLGVVPSQAQDIRTAAAKATVVDGYVVGVSLTDGGSGYGVPPAVSFAGGGGIGAVAETRVRNGVVDKIVLINAGSGYASQTAVSIAPPEMPMLESVRFLIGLTIHGRVGATHQVLETDTLVPPAWRVVTNVMVTSSPYVWVDESVPLQQRYYRVTAETEAPVLGPARLMSRLTARGTVGTTNWILGTYAQVLKPWRVLASVVVTSSSYVWVDEAASSLERQYQVSATPEAPVEKVDPRHWAWISPGMFMMGSPWSDRWRNDSEGPQTRVIHTKGFWMGRCEVTQEEYVAVVGSNPSYFKPPVYSEDLKRPVEQVSWVAATNYCAKLTEQERAAGRLPTGYAYRLPTEAEWEYGCRAGTTTRYSFGDALGCDDGCGWCALLDSHMWWCGNSGDQTHPVGQKLPNAWGLYDVHGNVEEWCGDWLSDKLPGGRVIDPAGAGSGSARVFRGGIGWYDWPLWGAHARDCRSALRGGSDPDFWPYSPGFRAVLAPGQ